MFLRFLILFIVLIAIFLTVPNLVVGWRMMHSASPLISPVPVDMDKALQSGGLMINP